MGIHKPVLTPRLTKARCQYLYGQWRRGHIYKEDQVLPKAKSALPVRKEDLLGLYNAFIKYMKDEHDMIVCEDCGCFTTCWDYYDDMQLCDECLSARE